jgi:hypothetical protein
MCLFCYDKQNLKTEICKFLCLDEDSHIVAEDITFTCQDVDYCEDYEYRCERIALTSH